MFELLFQVITYNQRWLNLRKISFWLKPPKESAKSLPLALSTQTLFRDGDLAPIFRDFSKSENFMRLSHFKLSMFELVSLTRTTCNMVFSLAQDQWYGRTLSNKENSES